MRADECTCPLGGVEEECPEHCICGADYEAVTLAHVLACCGVADAEVVAENTLRRMEGRRDLLAYPAPAATEVGEGA